MAFGGQVGAPAASVMLFEQSVGKPYLPDGIVSARYSQTIISNRRP